MTHEIDMTKPDKFEAGLAELGPWMRGERRKACKLLAASKKSDWWRIARNRRVLIEGLMDECESVAECKRVASEVLSKPWNWRAEYVIAECRRRDRKEQPA
jgi:hypothetical protein